VKPSPALPERPVLEPLDRGVCDRAAAICAKWRLHPSAAQNAGPGDRCITWNGMSLLSMEELGRIFLLLDPGLLNDQAAQISQIRAKAAEIGADGVILAPSYANYSSGYYTGGRRGARGKTYLWRHPVFRYRGSSRNSRTGSPPDTDL